MTMNMFKKTIAILAAVIMCCTAFSAFADTATVEVDGSVVNTHHNDQHRRDRQYPGP